MTNEEFKQRIARAMAASKSANRNTTTYSPEEIKAKLESLLAKVKAVREMNKTKTDESKEIIQNGKYTDID